MMIDRSQTMGFAKMSGGVFFVKFRDYSIVLQTARPGRSIHQISIE